MIRGGLCVLALLALWCGACAIRRVVWHRSGRCIHCAYPTSTRELCTECGASVIRFRREVWRRQWIAICCGTAAVLLVASACTPLRAVIRHMPTKWLILLRESAQSGEQWSMCRTEVKRRLLYNEVDKSTSEWMLIRQAERDADRLVTPGSDSRTLTTNLLLTVTWESGTNGMLEVRCGDFNDEVPLLSDAQWLNAYVQPIRPHSIAALRSDSQVEIRLFVYDPPPKHQDSQAPWTKRQIWSKTIPVASIRGR